jgi:hypothetical protein
MFRLTIAAIGIVALVLPTVCSSAQFQGDVQIEITVGKQFSIASAPPTFAFPTLRQLGPKGFLLAVWSVPDDWLKKEDGRMTLIQTEDGGETWGTPIVKPSSEAGAHSFLRCKDNRCVCLDYNTYQTADARRPSFFVGRSKDGKQFAWGEGHVTFPHDVLKWKNGTAFMFFSRSIVELADGSLLATMFGNFDADITDDKVRKDFNYGYQKIRYRTVLVRSTNGGVDWNYYSTIVYDSNAPGEGYDEPVMARTADGDLLCILRRGSAMPMVSCRSRDDGHTWSAPTMLPEYAKSVFPDLLLMSNGVLACSQGRPDNQIIFSVDGTGRQWTSPTVIYADPHYPQPCSTCGYTSIQEVAPGRLLYVYSYLENLIKPGAASQVRGVFIDVRRKQSP